MQIRLKNYLATMEIRNRKEEEKYSLLPPRRFTKPKKKVVQVSSCTSVLLRSNHIKYFFILAWDVIDKMVGLLLVNPTGSALMAWRRMVRNGQVVMEISWIFAQLADADPSAALGDNEVQE